MQKKWGIKRIAEALGLKAKSNAKVYNCKETMKHVMLALDGELSADEEKAFLSHINHCSRCLEKYEIEKTFKQFLTEKISRHPIPGQLVDQIRSRILGKADH
ncbi:MAG: zf-HC2 domain-containing protein [Chitinophagaceae bacterium]|nr:zf-HC2 domain-containing protein [Chitinophagaceae bacterium]